ncbi:hypothetical protein T439DRAFT_357047 [Meredithblackwellia eburnea MCA 4105]
MVIFPEPGLEVPLDVGADEVPDAVLEPTPEDLEEDDEDEAEDADEESGTELLDPPVADEPDVEPEKYVSNIQNNPKRIRQTTRAIARYTQSGVPFADFESSFFSSYSESESCRVEDEAPLLVAATPPGAVPTPSSIRPSVTITAGAPSMSTTASPIVIVSIPVTLPPASVSVASPPLPVVV